MSELDDLVRTRRFDEIHEARRQVIEDERAINEARATGRIDESRAKRLFQRAVDTYVRELEYLLNPPDDDQPNAYWHSESIGEFELPNGKVYQVDGLGEYLDMPEEIPVQVRNYPDNRYYELGRAEVETVTTQPPWDLLQNAFRTANAATAELGLELDIEEGSNRWEFREIKDVDDIDPSEWNDLSVFDNVNGDASEVGDD